MSLVVDLGEMLEIQMGVDLGGADVRVPEQLLNGPQIAARLRAEGIEPKVLYMSGYTENAILHNGQLDEGVHLLSKPFDERGLSDAIARVMDA